MLTWRAGTACCVRSATSCEFLPPCRAGRKLVVADDQGNAGQAAREHRGADPGRCRQVINPQRSKITGSLTVLIGWDSF
jgi:hypothetical protein